MVDLKLEARDLDLAALAPEAGVAGRITLSADAHGPLDAVTAHVAIPAGTPIAALGDKFSLGPVNIALDGKTLAIEALRIAHHGGGAADVHGRVGLAHQDLDLDVALSKFPLATLPGVATSDIPVSGFVSAKLHVAGRPERPELAGDIDLTDVVVRGVRLGKGHLALTPATVGPTRAPGVAVHGQLFDRFDVDVDAALLLPKGPSVHGRVAFRRLELHTLAPELVALGDGRSVASGRVAVDLEPGQPLALDVLLPELWLSIARAVDGPNGETTHAAGPDRGRAPGPRPRRRRSHRARRGALRHRRRRPARRRAPRRTRHLRGALRSPRSRAARSLFWEPSPSIGWAAICAPS